MGMPYVLKLPFMSETISSDLDRKKSCIASNLYFFNELSRQTISCPKIHYYYNTCWPYLQYKLLRYT